MEIVCLKGYIAQGSKVNTLLLKQIGKVVPYLLDFWEEWHRLVAGLEQRLGRTFSPST